MQAVGVRSYFLYPNNFQEHEAAEDELDMYIRSAEADHAAGFRPFALHGGYFSIILEKRGLAGFGNGIGYGEWRDSGYHRGGSAYLRIYIPKLHRFLNPVEAQSLIAADQDYFTADSDLLSDFSAAKRPLIEVQSAQATDHFMESRYQEIRFVKDHTEADIVAELRETVKRLSDIGELEAQRFGTSLSKWANAIDRAAS